MDVFDPKMYARAMRPLAEAETLPPWCYTSQEFYDAEVKEIFKKTWSFVGRVDEIPGPGDFITADLCNDSVIVVRDRENSINALANSCRHRGTRLVHGSGNCSLFSCPYHSWAYSLKGDLVATPGMEGVSDLDRGQYPLLRIRSEIWGGFIFVTANEKAAPLTKYLGNADETFSSYSFEDMRVARKKEYDLPCNWKLYIENAMEDYHTKTVHRVSIGTQVCSRVTSSPNWDAIHMPQETSVAVLPGEATPFPQIPTLRGKAAEGTYFAVIYPNWFFATTQDCMWWLHAQPRGPNRSIVTHGAVFPKDTISRQDFSAVVEKYYKRWDKSLPEDNEIAVLQQAGLNSSFARPGRLSLNEPIVHSMTQWVLDKVLDRSGGSV